jgi:alpha-amylase/alpha-mannosidase (GH57 family)
MPKKPLCVAILWHMHQPDYGDVQTGEIYLPWTRLHAVKDYHDMGALVEECPGLHLTINMVPALLDQLVAYGSGTARETYVALTVKEASRLDEGERQFLLRMFFQLPYKQMLFPYPRYRELFDKRGRADEGGEFPDGLKAYSARDYRDLQMWFNLSWCGHVLREDPEIAALFRKGKSYTEEDKRRLLRIQQTFAGGVIAYYRRLMEERGIEISTSPYYHPILPLLCDSRSAREALSSIPLPSNPFSFPEDAREQVRCAQKRYLELFGREACGMWPSEGSISDSTAALVRECGLRWLASDDGVLLNSLRKSGIAGEGASLKKRYSAHAWGKDGPGPCFFFRDHELSDLIGFTYSGWQAEDAVGDFIRRLRSIHESLPADGRSYVVPIILDGENAWEHYPNNGSDFLRLFYRRLVESKSLRTVTFSEFLELEAQRETLPTIMAGSWIYGNLATWLGHPEKNKAWDHLSAARAFLGLQRQAGVDEERFRAAFKEMMMAEGSDWFWWYGDDHQTQNAAAFDMLFRNHVKNVYCLLGRPYPLDLDLPIKKAEVKAKFRNPVHTITPIIDGKVSSYFEWLSAGYGVPACGESMHRTEHYLEKVHFGYDAQGFYLRIDLASSSRSLIPVGNQLLVHFVAPREILLALEVGADHQWRCRVVRSPMADLAPEFGAGKILELRLSLNALGILKPEELRLFVSIVEQGRELERFPPSGFLGVPVDPWGLDHEEWMV